MSDPKAGLRPIPARMAMVRGLPRSAVLRGLAFQKLVRQGVRTGEFKSEGEGIRKLRKRVWGD